MSSTSNDVDQIRRRMATIRRELHEDVRDVVATAEAATDWRRYLTSYPWAFLGAAFAAGYVIVPRRRASARVAETTSEELTKLREALEETRRAVAVSVGGGAPKAKRRKGLIGAAIGLATPLLLRAAQGYAMSYLENWVAQQQSRLGAFGLAAGVGPGPGPEPGGRPRADRPGGPSSRAGGPGPGLG